MPRLIASTSATRSAGGQRTRRRSPSAASLAEFWIEPGRRRAISSTAPPASRPRIGPRLTPASTFVSKDTAGFSATYKVRDAAGRKWSVKIGPEAQTEVVASRIVWAVGYHEVPSYFVERWIAVDNAKGAQLGGARFRPDEMAAEVARHLVVAARIRLSAPRRTTACSR